MFQWVFGYVAGAWILLEITDFLSGMFGWPDAVVEVFVTLLAFGLLVAAVLAWFHGERGRQEVTRPEVALLTGIGLVGMMTVAWVGLQASWSGEGSAEAASRIPTVTERVRSRGEAPTSSAGVIRTALAGVGIADPREASLALAVLPFVNLDPVTDPGPRPDGEPELRGDPAFADGVTEDILFEVSRIPGLRVISRTSTAQYRDSPLTLVEIGRELNVDLVLEGSARRVGDRARIVAQLIDARTDEHLWSGSFDHDLSDILRVQAEVAEEVAAAVAATLGVAGVEVSPGAPAASRGAVAAASSDPGSRPQVRTVNAGVYRSFLEGRRLVRSTDPDEVERGVALLDDVVRRDPELEAARVVLAEVLEAFPTDPVQGRRGSSGSPTSEARLLARRALEAPAPAAGPASRPVWQLAVDAGSLEEGEAALRAALRADPNDPAARRWYGLLLAATHRPEEGLEQLRIAHSVDPNSASLHSAMGAVLAQLGRPAEAVAAFDRALERMPAEGRLTLSVQVERALALATAGGEEGALVELRRFAAEAPGSPQALGALGYLAGRLGREAEAGEVLAALAGLEDVGPPEAPLPGVELARAQVLAALGDGVAARAALDRAVAEGGWVALSAAARRVRGKG